MKICQDWINVPATQAVCAALTAGGAQALFVGGCVRNALLDLAVSDIDIATDAEPEKVCALAGAAGIKAVPTGIEHGTVTLVADGLAHEVTTFRRDVATDGRRATVAFSGNVAEDAARRDFTMNALYALPDGTVIDPLNGLPDLQARHVRFIGSAEDRIREDYLRILRYFRFHAWYGDPDLGVDPDALAAIASHLDGLSRLSRERVGAELQKLLAAPDPAPSVVAMRTTGALGEILPGSDDRALAPLVDLERQAGLAPDPVRRLATLGDPALFDTLRLSRATMRRLDQVREAAIGTAAAAELGYRLGAVLAIDALAVRSALSGTPFDRDATSQVEKGASARFPITARDLMPAFQGPGLGRELDRLERVWIASGFSLDRAALLQS